MKMNYFDASLRATWRVGEDAKKISKVYKYLMDK